jgi:hypothetical protein
MDLFVIVFCDLNKCICLLLFFVIQNKWIIYFESQKAITNKSIYFESQKTITNKSIYLDHKKQ